MHHLWQATKHHWRRTVVLFSVTLLIVWNFASAAHQLDLIPEHHNHHHCQMFAGAQHGLIKTHPVLTAPALHHLPYSDVKERRLHSNEVRYTARAPPIFA
ncbi:DUF2607 family protein [Vibrio alfacsensis]|uniref:DUF2607 family protein n=1 Tax=Vibrio alfacsensis TaxID=1074311 RepID=UPI0040687973